MFDTFDTTPELMVLSVAFCRVFLFFLTLEIVLRYVPWWWISRREADTKTMSELMEGVWVGAMSFCGFTVLALTGRRVPRDIYLFWFFVLDAGMTYAMCRHLTPAWRLSSRWRGRVGACIALRALVSFGIAVALVVLDLQ